MLKKYLSLKIEYYLPDWQLRINQAKEDIKKWQRSIISLLNKLAIHFISVFFTYAALLFFINYLWFFVKETPIGLSFVTDNPSSIISDIFFVLEQNIFYLAFRLSLDILVTCLIVGLIVHVLALRRYFYDGYGLITRFIWIMLFASVTALDILGYNYSLNFKIGMVLYLFPTCCLLDTIFKFTTKLLPELSILFRIKKELVNIIRTAHIRNLSTKDIDAS